jgi:hypothetical protein
MFVNKANLNNLFVNKATANHLCGLGVVFSRVSENLAVFLDLTRMLLNVRKFSIGTF